MSQRIYINDNWSFTESFNEEFACGGEAPDEVQVRLPHTCKETPFNYFDENIYQMVSGYRRVLNVPESWEGKRIFLVVEAAAHKSSVWINGEKIAEHACGYTAYRTELTEFLRTGENLITIEVDSRESLDQPPFGKVIDYMTYGGIYREVYLEISEQILIEDVFLRPQVPQDVDTASQEPGSISFEGKLESEININGAAGNLYVRQKIMRYAGGRAANARPDIQADTGMIALSQCRKEGGAFITEALVPEALLWDVGSPNLYLVRTELYEKVDETQADLNSKNIICGWEAKDSGRGGTGKLFRIIDQKDASCGFRRSEFRADGYYLNGRKIKLRGLNRHQSFPYVGYAMPKSMQRLDADILKFELGVNAVRTSHYPCSQYFYDRCDETGLLVFTEIPGWQNIGGDEWKEQAVRNTRDMVLQCRNHPSVILWGVRINESQDDDAFYEKTNAAAKQLDPTRPTGGVRYIKKSHLLEDVYTYNDFSYAGVTLKGEAEAPAKGRNTWKGCEPKKNVTPDMGKAYLISEYNGHMFPTKPYDCEDHRAEHMLRHAAVLDSVAAEEDIAGSFGWCMFDYNTHLEFGSGDHICYHGVTDMFRNLKPAASVYAAQQDLQPVLEITSSMDIGEHPAGIPGRVFIITNADEVRMYRNDVLIRTYSHEDSAFKNLECGPIEVTDFIGSRFNEEGFSEKQAEDVKYLLNYYARFGSAELPKKFIAKAAKLMAKKRLTMDQVYDLYGKYIGSWGGKGSAYKFEAVKNGQVVKTVVKAAAADVHLEAMVDHTELREGSSYDVAAVRLRACDGNGNLLPYYFETADLSCEGPIEIIGPERVQLRGGCGGTYVRTTGQPGTAALCIEHSSGMIRVEFSVTV